MRYLAPVLGALLILIASCTMVTVPGKPDVSPSVVSNGTTLRLTWTAVAGATGYYIYYDNATTHDTAITSTSIDISTPYKVVDVTAYNSAGESDKYTLDLTAVVTQNLTAYAYSDASPLNSFGFTTDGNCVVYDDTDPSNNSKIAYAFIDTTTSGRIPLALWGSNEMGWNTTYGFSVASTGTDFDAYTMADTTTYNTMTDISANGLYGLWIAGSTTWSATDHFAKIKIISVAGNTITFEVAYQTQAGLRWLKS